jgi:hypothetical protein
MKEIKIWCEFPEEINWKKISLIKFDTEIYVAVRNKKEYLKYKKYGTKNVKISAWPILNKREGYWFSGFVSKKAIDKLDEFKNIPIKVDIEPPFPGKNFRLFKLLFWFFKYTVKKGENNDYLRKKIKEFNDVIISGFPLPLFLRKRYGHYDFKGKKTNFIAYTTFFPKFLRSIIRFYYKIISKKSDFVALGCISEGVFGNEPIYKNIDEFKKDLNFVREGLVVFNLRGLLKRKEFLYFLNSYFSSL